MVILENVLPKVNGAHRHDHKLPSPRRASHQAGVTMMSTRRDHEHQEGVVVVGPGGELINVGHTLIEDPNNNTDKSENNNNNQDDVVYRLFDQIPPYLYYTNKLEEGVRLSYATPHSSQDGFI